VSDVKLSAIMKHRKRKMKGVSELIVVLALILVAILAVFAFRAWIQSQQSKLPGMDIATASYTVNYDATGTKMIITLTVENNLNNQVNFTDFAIVLNNGTVLTKTTTGVSISSTLPDTLRAKEEKLYTITFGIAPITTIRELKIQITDLSTGQTQWITATGG
jgi:Tfp pilus assembly protein FimT